MQVVRLEDLSKVVHTLVCQAMADGGEQQNPVVGDSGESHSGDKERVSVGVSRYGLLLGALGH